MDPEFFDVGANDPYNSPPTSHNFSNFLQKNKNFKVFISETFHIALLVFETGADVTPAILFRQYQWWI